MKGLESRRVKRRARSMRRAGGSPLVPHALIAVLGLLGMAVALSATVPSAQAQEPPATPRVITNLEYGAPGDTSNVLDAYLPEDGRSGRAAIVVVHGGGWVGGDRSQVATDAQILALKGFVAFSIDYGTTRPERWTSELEDVRRAVKWVQDHAKEYGVDATKVGLLGSSAGGHLSMLVGTLGVGDTTHPPVKAVASWSGPSDLTTLAPTAGTQTTLPPAIGGTVATKPPSACVGQPACIGLLGPEYIETFLGCTLDDCPETYVDASPVFHVTRTTPPMFLAGAQNDLIPVSQNFEMVNALTAVGVTSRLQIIEGTQHAESYRSVSLPPTIEFFDQFLNQGADPSVPAGSPPTTVAGSQSLPALTDGSKLPTPAVPAVATDPKPVRLVKQHLIWVLIGITIVALGVALIARGRRQPTPVRSAR